MSREIKTPDVLVVGGGVIGCAVARELAGRDVDVALVDRATPGRSATWAAAGMLTPQGEGRAGGAFLELCMESLALFPAFAQELKEETGQDPAYRPMATLVATRSAEAAAELEASVSGHRDRGAAASWLSGAQVLERAPELNPGVQGGLWYQNEGQVDNRALGRALWSGAARRGVAVETGVGVESVELRSGRAEAVRLSDGRTISAGCIVVAAGAWSGHIAGLPRPLPVRPIRGQMVALETVPDTLPCLLSMDHVYLVPRASGHTLVGATLEDVGFRERTTAAGISSLLKGALDAVPGLATAPVVDTWAGLRPGTPDELPIMGPDPQVEGLLYATGHYRNGILLTPVTAQVVADAILEGDACRDLSPYRADRFEDTSGA